MARKLAFLLLPLLLLLAACTGGGDKNGSSDTDDAQPPSSDAAATATDDSGAAVEATDTVTGEDSGDAGGGDPFAVLNPFDVLSGLNGSPSVGEPDPALAASLLTAGDLPDGFTNMGSYGYSMPSEVGNVDLAASIFSSGAVESGEFNAMVMSAAMTLPPEALDQMAGFELSEDDLGELESLAGDAGLGFADIEVLDASGLGDGGFGMRMTMDIADMLGGLGASDSENPLPDGIAMDMYGFLDGDQMRMVIVMAPAGGSTGVDARDLAEAMDAK